MAKMEEQTNWKDATSTIHLLNEGMSITFDQFLESNLW